MKTAWAAGFGVCVLLAVAAVYEVFERSLTAILKPAYADRDHGMQGDACDSQKNRFLAGLGAVLALPVSAALAARVTNDAAAVGDENP
jgi:uncharacterized membrane protein YjdF